MDATLFDLTARLEASLDFPDEGYHFVGPDGVATSIATLIAQLDALLDTARRGRLVREGAQVVIAGRTNAGKSSLFNALAGAGRAIVTDIPGTTRDLLTETVDICGVPVTLVDTAGVRIGSSDPVELEGMSRASAARDVAALVIVVLDRSEPLTAEDEDILRGTYDRRRILVANKSDRPAAWTADVLATVRAITVSATEGSGMPALRTAIVNALAAEEPTRDVPAITNIRHVGLLSNARLALERAKAAASIGTPEEFVLADINDARMQFEEITGARTADDVLTAIFSKFCIGK
jgi:tRNA modification GTPase